jgi:uncharacterized protein (DUF2252 family)
VDSGYPWDDGSHLFQIAALRPSRGGANSATERLARGKALRSAVPRSAQAECSPLLGSRDPIALLEASNAGRMPELVPIRIGRMLRSPFTFMRGSAALMAHDLNLLPRSGIQTWACGDCHLLNFGLFATAERNLIFDLNDFDEAHPAPWEWDVKRLASSFVLAGRDNNHSEADCRKAARRSVRSYRQHLREYIHASPLDVWYARFDADDLIEAAPTKAIRRSRQSMAAKARRRIADHLFPKITTLADGHCRLTEQPPVLTHVCHGELEQRISEDLEDYQQSLSDERRVLLGRYTLEDVALKVVGIGSVGTRCLVALYLSEDGHPLILQIKQASPSVLEPYTQPSTLPNHGQRVVMGQRLMQSGSDLFLGWFPSRTGNDFFVRQLRDMKMSYPIEDISPLRLQHYADYCGWSLARAHARGGDAATISGYLGQGDAADQAMETFAIAYADQIERDHDSLKAAVQAGRVEALIETDR